MNRKGYERLAEVLHQAYDQASIGKGEERHADGQPFEEQVGMLITRLVGTGFPRGQAIKKLIESQRLEGAAKVAELLGAINYTAMAIIAEEEERYENRLSGSELAMAMLDRLGDNPFRVRESDGDDKGATPDESAKG